MSIPTEIVSIQLRMARVKMSVKDELSNGNRKSMSMKYELLNRNCECLSMNCELFNGE